MRRALLVPLTMLLLVSGSGVASAAPASAGKEFWLGFPDALQQLPASQLSLLITAESAAAGTVAVPGTSFSQSISVTPGTTTTVAIPIGVLAQSDDTVAAGQSVHVTSDGDIAIHGLDYASSGLTDGYLGLPVGLLGTEYRVSVPNGASCGMSEFEVIGTQAATTVTVTAPVVVGAHAADTPYQESLDAGSVYLGQSATSVSGTTITSTKPIAVFEGDTCRDIPLGTFSANALVEQVPPVASWGTEYVVRPFEGRTDGDVFAVQGSVDGTQLTVEPTTPGAPTSINAGQTAEFPAATALHVTADHPVLLTHYAHSRGFDDPGFTGAKGDPTMIVVPSVQHYASTQTASTPAAGFAGRYLNVSVATADVASLRVDGVAPASGLFAPVGASGWSVAALAVAPGAHVVTDAGPVGVEVYGFDPGNVDAFGYPGALGDGARAPLPTPPPPVPPAGSPAGGTPKPPSFASVVTFSQNRRCTTGRAPAIRVRAPRGAAVTKVVVKINGRRATRFTGAKLKAPIRLGHLPTGRVKVTVTVTLRDRRVVSGSRTFAACPRR